MKVKVDIDTKVFVRLLLVVVCFGIGLFMIYAVRSALVLIASAAFLALALNPPVSKLAHRLPGRSRIGATAIAYIIVLVFLGGFIVLVVPPIIEQSSKFVSTVPGLIDDISKKSNVFDDFIQRYGLGPTIDNAIEDAKRQTTAIAANLGNVLVGGVGAFMSGLASMIFVLVLTFLMLIEGPMWMQRAWGLYKDPEKLERHQSLVRRMYRIVTGFVNGQLAVAAIAALCTLAMLLALSVTLGLPANVAVPLAVIIFLTDMVPMIGSTIGAILVGLVLLINSPLAAGVFVVFFLIYQQIENNFIAPTIQSKNVDLSALLILCAILIGGTLGGLLGAIIAIPVAGCLKVLLIDNLDYARKKRESQQKISLKKLVKKS